MVNQELGRFFKNKTNLSVVVIISSLLAVSAINFKVTIEQGRFLWRCFEFVFSEISLAWKIIIPNWMLSDWPEGQMMVALLFLLSIASSLILFVALIETTWQLFERIGPPTKRYFQRKFENVQKVARFIYECIVEIPELLYGVYALIIEIGSIIKEGYQFLENRIRPKHTFEGEVPKESVLEAIDPDLIPDEFKTNEFEILKGQAQDLLDQIDESDFKSVDISRAKTELDEALRLANIQVDQLEEFEQADLKSLPEIPADSSREKTAQDH